MKEHKILKNIGIGIVVIGVITLLVYGSLFLSRSIRSSYREQVRIITERRETSRNIVIEGGIFNPVLTVISPGEKISFVNRDTQVHTVTCEDSTYVLNPQETKDKTIYEKGEYRCSTSSHESVIIVR